MDAILQSVQNAISGSDNKGRDLLVVGAVAGLALGVSAAVIHGKKKQAEAQSKNGRATPMSQRVRPAHKNRMVRIYLLRHGESTNNAREQGVIRSCDPEVTALGANQATYVGQFLNKSRTVYNIKNVFISPMAKTLGTAKPLVSLLNGVIPCVVRQDLFEYGGCYQGERAMSEKDRFKKYPVPQRGMGANEIRQYCPGVQLDSRIGNDGWWKGGKETDPEYLARISGVVDWLWSLDENSLLITHGKTLDTLLKVALEIPRPLEKSSAVSILHGGCAMTCLELDHKTGKMAVCYMNMPLVHEPKLRTGHKMGEFQLRGW